MYTASATWPEVRSIVCPRCATVNRVPAERDARTAKFGRCHHPLFTGAPVAATAGNFLTHVERSDIPVLVDFWAEWCGPCHVMEPVFAAAAADVEPDVRFLKVDIEKVDIEAERSLAARYNIQSIPMLMLFRRGLVAAKQAGPATASSLRAWLTRHLGTAAD